LVKADQATAYTLKIIYHLIEIPSSPFIFRV
jgi:hypothetical protein